MVDSDVPAAEERACVEHVARVAACAHEAGSDRHLLGASYLLTPCRLRAVDEQ